MNEKLTSYILQIFRFDGRIPSHIGFKKFESLDDPAYLDLKEKAIRLKGSIDTRKEIYMGKAGEFIQIESEKWLDVNQVINPIPMENANIPEND